MHRITRAPCQPTNVGTAPVFVTLRVMTSEDIALEHDNVLEATSNVAITRSVTSTRETPSSPRSIMPPVTVNLYAGLRTFIDDQPSVDVEVDAGTTIVQVIDRLGIPVEKTRIIFNNNRAADLDDAVAPGDNLSIFPAIGGG